MWEFLALRSVGLNNFERPTNLIPGFSPPSVPVAILKKARLVKELVIASQR